MSALEKLEQTSIRIFKFTLPIKTVFLAIGAAILILIVFWDSFFSPTQEMYVTVTAETAGEICLCDVVVDGQNIPIFQVEVVENSGWVYREEYDNFMIWPEEDGVENYLTMRFIAKEVHLGFPFTPYAGSVTIAPSIGDGGTWNLRCGERIEGEPVEYADFPIDCRRIYLPWELMVYGAAILLAVSFLCLFSLYAADLVKKKVKSIKKKAAGIPFPAHVVTGWIYVIFVFVLSCVVSLGDKINVFGSPYFSPVTVQDIAKAVLLFIAFFAAGNIVLYAVNRYGSKLRPVSVKSSWWGAAFLLLTLLWMPYLLAYYPGILTPDSFTSLWQAKDISTLYNHVPIAYTLMITFFAKIGWSMGDGNFGVFLFTLAQYLIMAGVLSYLAYWIRRKTGNKIISWIVLLFYGLNPVVAMYSITMWKDVLFSAWMALLCIFLFDISYEGGKELETKKKLMQLSVLFMLVSFGRNNGIYVAFICWLMLLISYRRVRKKILIAGASTMLATLLIQGPIYDSLGISQAGYAESVGIPIQQISYTVINDQPLDEEDQAFLGKIIPLETMKADYTPVSSDDIKFNPEFNTSFFQENIDEFMKLYFRLLPEHFKSYVKAYLLSTSGFWKIETIGWMAAQDIYVNDMGIYNVDYLEQYFHINLKSVVSNLLEFLRHSPIMNVGVMVWLVFFYVITCFRQKQAWKAYLALPLIGCWATLMIATPVYSQFRYVYYYHLMLPMVCYMFLVKKERNV